MSKDEKLDPADYIVPLNMNGLQGRMLHMPAPPGKTREILLIYGHHSSLERWFGLAQVLNRYGAVTMPDLPGFGGMESFYKIGQKPSTDALADYLAAFVKMRYQRKRRITIVGMSLGFTVVTRMLQRFPNLTKKVDLLVSLVGFVHRKDFSFSWLHYWTFMVLAKLFNGRISSWFFREIILHPFVLRTFYGKTPNAKHKFKDLSPEDHVRMMDIEVGLWRDNDVRTYMYTTRQIMTLDNTHTRIDLPLWHVGVAEDHFFDNVSVERHMRMVFNDFIPMKINMTKHAPTVIADAKDAAPFIPPRLRKLLSGK
jgi:pimeloyl-ACP methyl ester carboxylesterase